MCDQFICCDQIIALLAKPARPVPLNQVRLQPADGEGRRAPETRVRRDLVGGGGNVQVAGVPARRTRGAKRNKLGNVWVLYS